MSHPSLKNAFWFSDTVGISAVLERHEGSRRIRTEPLADASRWRVQWRTEETGAGRWRGALLAALKRGGAPMPAVGVRFDFSRWSREVFVLLPGAVYAGNRFPAFATSYPPDLPPRPASDPDHLPLQSEVPRLRWDSGLSCLRQMSSDAATPGAGFYFPSLQRGLWILTPQENRWGLFGCELEETDARDAAALTVFSPGFLREFSYAIGCDRVPSPARAPDLPAGAEIEIPLWIEEFDCAAPEGLFERLRERRRAMVPEPAARHELPFSEAWRILEDKYARENWVEPRGYFSVGVEPMRSRHYSQNWQMGWVGGMITPHAFTLRGSPEMRERALRNFDFVFPRGQAPSGYFLRLRRRRPVLQRFLPAPARRAAPSRAQERGRTVLHALDAGGPGRGRRGGTHSAGVG